MDKVLPILEKYVEWIALGIAGLFLALMAYSYLAKPAVTVPLGTSQVAPGEVDPQIQTSPEMTRLKSNLERGVIEDPKIPQASTVLVAEFNTVVPPPKPQGGPINGPTASTEVASDVELVIPPIATFNAFSSGWSLCTWPIHQVPPAGAPSVAGQPGGVPGAIPGVLPGADGGFNPGGFNPGGGAPVQMAQREFGWWTGKFQISNEQLYGAMVAAKLNPADANTFKTAFLGVEVMRQEKQLDGGWGKETPVDVLPEYAPLVKANPLPKDNASAQEKNVYMIWAAQNVQMLVQPAFPQVIAGDPWYLPGTPAPAQNNPGFNPEFRAPQPQPFVPGEVPAPRPPAFRPGRPEAKSDLPGGVMLTSGPAFNPGRGFTPDEGSAPAVPGTPGAIQPSFAGGSDASGAGPVPGVGDPDGVFYPQVIQQAAINQGLKDLPTNVLVHDITVQPGKTYRYKIRYHIRNPLFNVERVKPEFKNKLVLTSAWSDWSTDYTVPARVEFWVNAVNVPRLGVIESVDFDVVVADPTAGWKPEKVKAMPGDQIAKGTGDSGWSLVDVRPMKDGKNYEIILADVNGTVQRRELQKDIDDPKRRERVGVPEQPPVVPGLGAGPDSGIPPVRPGRPGAPGRGFTPDE